MKNKILTAHQTRILTSLGTHAPTLMRDFYLTGGTALASFYLQHRYSEDLDFFSEKEVDTLGISSMLKKLKKELKIKKVDFEQSFNRNLFFIHFPNEIIKTEFTYFPFPRIEKGGKEHGIEIDSLIDIAVNKLFTIYQRTKARDFIDLYCICKEKNYSISDLIKKAKIKFDWHIDHVQLGTQFIKAKQATDLPLMIRNVSVEDWHNFFMQEAKKLKKHILI